MLDYSRIHGDALKDRYERYRNYSQYTVPTTNSYSETRSNYSKRYQYLPHKKMEDTIQHPSTLSYKTNVKRPDSSLRYTPSYSNRNMYNKYTSPQQFSTRLPYYNKELSLDRNMYDQGEWDKLRGKSYFTKSLHETDDRSSRFRQRRSLRPPTPDLQQLSQKELGEESKTKENEQKERQEKQQQESTENRKYYSSNNAVHPHSVKNKPSNNQKGIAHINGTQKSNSSFSSSTSSNVSETNEIHALGKTEVSQLLEEKQKTSSSSCSSSSSLSSSSSFSSSTSSSTYSSSSSSSSSSTSEQKQRMLKSDENDASSGDISKLEKAKQLANGTQHLVPQEDKEGVITHCANEPYLAIIAESLLRKEVQLKKLELMLSSEKELFAHQLRQRTISRESLLPMEKNVEQDRFTENTKLEKTRLHEFVENLINSSENVHQQRNLLENKGSKVETLNKQRENNKNECACEDEGIEQSTPSSLLDSNHSSLLLLPPPPSYEHAIRLKKLNATPQHKVNLIRATVRMPSSTETFKKINEWSTHTPISASMLDEQVQTDLSHDLDSNNDGVLLSPRDDSAEQHDNIHRLQDSIERDKHENSTDKKAISDDGNKRNQHGILVHVANQQENELINVNEHRTNKSSNGGGNDSEKLHKKKKIKVKIRKPHLAENNGNRKEALESASDGLSNTPLQATEESWAAANTISSNNTNLIKQNDNSSLYKHKQSLLHDNTDTAMNNTLEQRNHKKQKIAVNPNLASLNSPFTSGDDGTCANLNTSQQVIMLAPLSHYKHLNSVNNNEPFTNELMNSSHEEAVASNTVVMNDGNIVYMLQEPYKSSTEHDSKVKKRSLMSPEDSNSRTNDSKNNSKSKYKESRSIYTNSANNYTTKYYHHHNNNNKELLSFNTRQTKSASTPLLDFELQKSKKNQTVFTSVNASQAQSENKSSIPTHNSQSSSNPHELLSSSIYIEKNESKSANVLPVSSSLSSSLLRSKAMPVLTSEEIQKFDKNKTVDITTNLQSHVAPSHEPIEPSIPNVVIAAGVHGKQPSQLKTGQPASCQEEMQPPSMKDETFVVRENATSKPIVDSVEHSHAQSANLSSPLVVSFPSPPSQSALQPTSATAIAATTTPTTTQDQQEQQQYNDNHNAERENLHVHRKRSNQVQGKAICGNCCKG